jgi:CBS domain-containing protein
MQAHNNPFDAHVKDIVRSKSGLPEDGDGVLTAEPSTTVYECIARMDDHGVGSIVVMDGDEIAGIFTERDYMNSIALKGRSSETTAVEDVMTTDVKTVRPDKPLEECLQLMTELRFRHLPVVNEDDALIGLISIGDCVKQIVDTAHKETEQLRQYVTGTYPA